MRKPVGTNQSRVDVSRAQPSSHRLPTQTLLNSIGEGLIVTNEFGAITHVNAYARNALNFEENELIGNWLPKTVVAVDQYGRVLDRLERPDVQALASGQTVSARSHYITKDGNVLPVHITVSPILANGSPVGTILVFRDLTREQQLDIAKEEFVSLASHQLRTPATAVKSILSMIAHGDFGTLNELQLRYIQKAIDSNDRQLEVIEGLLNVALVDSGKMELDLDYLDLNQLMRETLAEQVPFLSQRKQTLRFTAHKDGELKLLADPKKVRMVVENLVSNASKYSPPGTNITVKVWTDDDTVHIAVADEGVGISEDEIPKLFAKFSRFENELSHAASGAGLGLFLAKSIIELHHGTISVTSEPSRGSTFTIKLPLKWNIVS